MTRVPVHPGTVDWSGDNPGISLKRSPEGPFDLHASYFRVAVSPHGPGHAVILLWKARAEDPRNGIYTDNPSLAAWLRDEFASHFGIFRDNPLVSGLPIREAKSFESSGDVRSSHIERIRGEGLELELAWLDLARPFMVELTAERSATGRHEMFSVFVPAGRGRVSLNGESVEGEGTARDFHGFQSSYVFLAFSETWVRP